MIPITRAASLGLAQPALSQSQHKAILAAGHRNWHTGIDATLWCALGTTEGMIVPHELVIVALFVDVLLLHALVAGLLIAPFRRPHRETVGAFRLDVRQRQQSFERSATTLGADRHLAAHDQRLEFVLARLADILVNRHT